MKKLLVIALTGVVCLGGDAWAQTPAPARPATAPAAPAPPSAARPANAPRPAPAAVPAAPAPLEIVQAPAPPAAPGPAPVRGLPSGPNVRFDVTITDTGGPKPVTKTLSLTIGSSNNNGSVRQTSQAPNPNPGPPTIPISLNVDVRNVNWLENGIRATVVIVYQPYLPDAKAQPGMVTANATSVFVDGRRMQILATSDPVSDRKTTIDVTATVVK